MDLPLLLLLLPPEPSASDSVFPSSQQLGPSRPALLAPPLDPYSSSPSLCLGPLILSIDALWRCSPGTGIDFDPVEGHTRQKISWLQSLSSGRVSVGAACLSSQVFRHPSLSGSVIMQEPQLSLASLGLVGSAIVPRVIQILAAPKRRPEW
jgi:hypothetical protein